MKNKKGFISMTLVYTFLIVFLFLMLAILRTYNEKDKFLEAINSQIDTDISEHAKIRSGFVSKLLSDNTPTSDDGLRFFTIANSTFGNGNGLFYTDNPDKTDENQDGETSRIYFFRGDVETNHLIFANFCWRIIRTNEDGSIRIRYNGKVLKGNKCPTLDSVYNNFTSISIASSQYQTSSTLRSDVSFIDNEGNPNLDIGDVTKESEVKKVLDNWYFQNLVQNQPEIEGLENVRWSDYVSQRAIYCNDRSTFKLIDGIEYYGSVGIVPRFIDQDNLDVYNRNNIENTVTFACPGDNEEDMFDVNGSGNNLLIYPIGLLTAQDIVYAGGYMTYEHDMYNGGSNHNAIKNTKFYLSTGSSFWTMSPFSINAGNENGAKVVYVDEHGTMRGGSVTESHAVIPVISLKSSTLIASGKGTSNNQYMIDYYN